MIDLIAPVMIGWIPLVLGLFIVLPPRRAVIVAFLFAWLFLPQVSYALPGIPDYSKSTATCYGVLLATALFDPNRLLSLRFRWFDLPAVVWCVCPGASSISNGLGLYDAMSAVLHSSVTWGLPYLIGRAYFFDLQGVRELALGIFIGGLVYMPLCLWEIRMSPQLHHTVYGFHQHSFMQTVRFGGFRPMVFMQHGLMVGMWMTSASLIGVWIWKTRALKSLGRVPIIWFVVPMLITAVLCKSIGALALLVLGAGVLFAVKWTSSVVPVLCLVLLAPIYMTVRSQDLWSGSQLVTLVANVIDEDRANSLQFRLDNELILIDKALQRPLFGWGRWGRSRVYNADGSDVSVTDGLWVIAMGQRGLVGVAALTLLLLLPGIVLIRRFPPTVWSDVAFAPAGALAALLMVYMVDCFFNAMINPIFILVAGGLTAFACTYRGTVAQKAFTKQTMGQMTAQSIIRTFS